MNDVARCITGAWALALLVAAPAAAQVCSVNQLTRDLTLFRRYSLDLRGRLPSAAETDALVARGGFTESDVEAMLRSGEIKNVERERLRNDIYGGLAQGFETDFGLVRTDASSAFVYPPSGDVFWLPNRGRVYRGGNDFKTCDTTREEPATNPRPVRGPDGREGWVWVTPYWAPGTRVKVCAFDAQPFEVGPTSGVRCGTMQARGVADCGCGPNLQFCQLLASYPVDAGITQRSTGQDLNDAYVEQSLRFVDRILDEGRPYSDLLLSSETEVDGRIAHNLMYQTGTVYSGDLSHRPDLGYPIPPLPWAAREQWRRVSITSKSAGVLSQPHFLMKFASNRARANRFANAFLCTSFQAPPGGLPAPGPNCPDTPDLSKRCGCRYCHASLEPMAAHWGRFAEQGTHELMRPEFPQADPACRADAGPMPERCRRFYLTEPTHPDEAPYVGQLRSYLFADVNGYAANVEAGPRELARAAVQDGRFARCVVQKQFTRLVGRPPREDLVDERALLERLTRDFIASNHDLRALLRALLDTPQYRTLEGATEP